MAPEQQRELSFVLLILLRLRNRVFAINSNLSNSYFFANWECEPYLIWQNTQFEFTLSCKGIRIRKSEVVTKAQLLGKKKTYLWNILIR